MSDRTFTPPLADEAVWLLAHHGAMDAEQIGLAIRLDPGVVRQILAKREADERAADQVRALAGPFFPASQSCSETTPAQRALVACSDIEHAILLELAGPLGDFDLVYLSLIALRARLGLHKEILRGAVASLRDQGLASYRRGLFDDDGMPYGSGYCITEKGRKHLCDVNADRAGA